jgi:subtilisin family serine protease
MNQCPRSLVAACFALALAACGGGDESGGSTPPPPPPPPPVGQPLAADVIVQLKRGVALQPLASRYQLTLAEQFGKRPIYRLRVASGAGADAAIALLRADPGVRFAERNVEKETPEGRPNQIYVVGGDAGRYAAQWAPQAMNLPAARALSTGAGVRVAVLDTGVDSTHPTLAPRMARSSSGAILGRDFVDDDADASEAGSEGNTGFGHGTHVAGLVLLAAPAAHIMPLRVLDAQGRGNTWVLAEALGWAVDPDGNPASDDGAHIINLSLGGTQRTDLIKTASELANCSFDDDDDDFQDPGFDDDRARCALGHAATVVAAAGNSGSSTEQQFPAAENVKGLLAVAASTETRRVAGFSNSGSWIKLAAPGELIMSTLPGGRWGVWNGTSMAAPLAAGSAALLLGTAAPNVDPTRTALRQWQPEAVVDRLQSRSKALCGSSIKQLDALSALSDTQVPDPIC